MTRFFTVLACLGLSMAAVSQNLSHPVIEKVQVMYKPLPGPSNTMAPAQGPPDIKVKGTATITLKTDSGIVNIYFRILDKQSNAVLYQASYAINSGNVISDGVTLYSRQGNDLQIANPAIVSLKPYVYELYTDNAGGEKSTTYSIIQ